MFKTDIALFIVLKIGLITCELVVIAHRGASGYIPEHTLGAYALAITMDADYIEPDLVMSKDGQLVALHDNELSTTTDVAKHPEFASRQQTKTIDGTEITGWFSEDFTLAELKTLRTVERIPDIRPGNARMDGTFQIPTFQEILTLVRSMQRGRTKRIGIYPEIKHSTYFKRLGLPMERLVVRTFLRNGYFRSTDPVYIQSLEISNLKELKRITSLKLTQLYDAMSLQPFDQREMCNDVTYGDLASPEGLKEVAKYASAVGPDKSYIISENGNMLGAVTSFVKNAHAAGLLVHPYVFRAENTFLPVEFKSNSLPGAYGDFRAELKLYLDTGIDGLFTDQPDKAVRVRNQYR